MYVCISNTLSNTLSNTQSNTLTLTLTYEPTFSTTDTGMMYPTPSATLPDKPWNATPTSFPFENAGPPLFPGLIAASTFIILYMVYDTETIQCSVLYSV